MSGGGHFNLLGAVLLKLQENATICLLLLIAKERTFVKVSFVMYQSARIVIDRILLSCFMTIAIWLTLFHYNNDWCLCTVWIISISQPFASALQWVRVIVFFWVPTLGFIPEMDKVAWKSIFWSKFLLQSWIIDFQAHMYVGLLSSKE